MVAKEIKHHPMLAMLLNEKIPAGHRLEVLKGLAHDESPVSDEILTSYLDLKSSGPVAGYTQKKEELNQLIEEINEGPRRLGTFIALQQPEGLLSRAVVKLESGDTAFPIVVDAGLASKLQCGDNVMLDARAIGLIDFAPLNNTTGEEVNFEKRIGDSCVEVLMRGDERHVYVASKTLMDSLEGDKVAAGSRILVCPRRQVAFALLAAEDGAARYRYLDRSPVPDVVVDRDIGAPPPYIEEVRRLVWLEMTNPELRRKYGLRRCMMKLLTGMPGTGKSYSILGLIREIYEMVSGITGTPLKDLPPRVMRLNASSVLSKWLGESDKNISRFFGEVEQLSKEPFITSGGSEVILPVIVVLEEIDGLARSRGEDAVMDRIFTTVLELFDPTRSELKDNFIIFLGTTNKPHLVDSGFLRRIGGTIEQFSALDRNAFAAVLKKHLAGKPLAADEGDPREDILSSVVYELTAWLFSPNGEDRGQIALSFIGTGESEIHFRRDFLTPGLVDRAVQHTAQLACEAEAGGAARPGLTSAGLKTAIDEQIQAIIKILRADNVTNYLTIPEESRVQSVRAIEQPEILAAQLMRAA